VLAKAIGRGTPFAALAGTRAAMAKIISGEAIHAGTLNANPLCLATSKWCLDQGINAGADHPATIIRLSRRLMDGLRALADENGIPLRPQGPGMAFHTVMLRGRTDRDYVTRQDAPRWAHLRLCLQEEGVRGAIERGLWWISMVHPDGGIGDALARAAAKAGGTFEISSTLAAAR